MRLSYGCTFVFLEHPNFPWFCADENVLKRPQQFSVRFVTLLQYSSSSALLSRNMHLTLTPGNLPPKRE